MNKRSLRSERPRSARIRRRPSLPCTSSDEQNKDGSADTNEAERSSLDVEKSNSHNFKGGTIIPDGFKGFGMKNDHRGKRTAGVSTRTSLNIPPVLRMETRNSIVDVKFRERGPEPPKSPRILPKLDKRMRKPLSGSTYEDDFDDSTVSVSKGLSHGKSLFSQTVPTASHAFLNQNRESGNSALQLGKHYSVLPDIAVSKDNVEGSSFQ